MSNLPHTVNLFGSSGEVFQQAAHLATIGYTFSKWEMVQALPSTSCILVMELGEVDADTIKAAEQAIARAKAAA